MKKFRWILLSGLLVATTQMAHAQAPGNPGAPGSPTGATADAGGISNVPAAATTTTTTTTGVAPDASGSSFVPADDAAISPSDDSSSMPNTGGEPMIAVLAGLSIAGAAFAMRRKVTA